MNNYQKSKSDEPTARDVVNAYLNLGNNWLQLEDIYIIENMVQAYGAQNVLNTISCVQPKSLSALGKALVYLYGNRDNIDPSLKLLFPPREEIDPVIDANGELIIPDDEPIPYDVWESDDKFRTSDDGLARPDKELSEPDNVDLHELRLLLEIEDRKRLERSAITPISKEVVDDYCMKNHQPNLYSLWEEETGEPLSDLERQTIQAALINFGIPLTQRAIEVVVGGNKLNQEERLQVFVDWLIFATERNFKKLDALVIKAGHTHTMLNWSLPSVEFIGLQIGFYERVGRPPSRSEYEGLEKLLTRSEYDLDSICYSIKTFPKIPFSIDELTVYHFERTQNYEALIEYIQAQNPPVYRCDECNCYLQELIIDYNDNPRAVDYCPTCNRIPAEHYLEPHMDKRIVEYLSKIDDPYTVYLIELSYQQCIASYCSSCDSHFFDGLEIITRLQKIERPEE